MEASIYTIEIIAGNRLVSAVCMETGVLKKPRLGIENEIAWDLHKRRKDPWEGRDGMALFTESGSLEIATLALPTGNMAVLIPRLPKLSDCPPLIPGQGLALEPYKAILNPLGLNPAVLVNLPCLYKRDNLHLHPVNRPTSVNSSRHNRSGLVRPQRQLLRQDSILWDLLRQPKM